MALNWCLVDGMDGSAGFEETVLEESHTAVRQYSEWWCNKKEYQGNEKTQQWRKKTWQWTFPTLQGQEGSLARSWMQKLVIKHGQPDSLGRFCNQHGWSRLNLKADQNRCTLPCWIWFHLQTSRVSNTKFLACAQKTETSKTTNNNTV